MSKVRTWVLGAVAGMLVVVIGGWMLGISPIFTQISAANAQTTSIQTSNASTEAQLVTLKSQFAGISKLQDSLNTLRLSIPEAQAASTFIHEVTSLSGAAGTTVQSVSIENATLYTGAAPAATTAPAPVTTPAPTTPATTTPAVTSNGLVIIPVTVTVVGSLGQDQAFISALQNGSRLFVSSSLALTTDVSSGNLTAVISGDIFTLQGSSDTPSTDPTSTPSDGSTSTPYPTITPTPTMTPTPSSTTSSSTTTGGTSGTSSGGNSGGTKPKSTPKPPSTPNPINSGH